MQTQQRRAPFLSSSSRATLCSLLLLASTALSSNALGNESPWLTSFEIARDRAAHSGKDLLICFTLNQWNAASQRMEEQILSQTAFAVGLSAKFELVRFDLSAGSANAEAASRWKQHFEVTSYPSIVLANSQGVPYAYSGHLAGDVESYVAHLQGLFHENQERRLLLKNAPTYPEKEQAVILGEAIPDLGARRTVKFYGDLMRELVVLDTQNSSGRVELFRKQLADFDALQRVSQLGADAGASLRAGS